MEDKTTVTVKAVKEALDFIETTFRFRLCYGFNWDFVIKCSLHTVFGFVQFWTSSKLECKIVTQK